MSTPNQSGNNNPNTAQTPQNNQPANNSAAGNTPSGAAGAGDATSANSNASGATGNGQPNANANTVTFTPEQQAEIERRENRAAAAARRQATEEATRERERLDAEARGDVQGLLDNERREHAETRRQLGDARRQLNALTVALEENLPRPTEVAPRLRGNTIDELRADARSFAALLGNQVPRPEHAPATPSGGGSPQTPSNEAGSGAGGGGNQGNNASVTPLTDDDASAEFRTGMYSGLG